MASRASGPADRGHGGAARCRGDSRYRAIRPVPGRNLLRPLDPKGGCQVIRTLAWKEYREQRGLWLAIVLLGGLLAFNLSLLAKGGLWEAHNDTFVREVV